MSELNGKTAPAAEATNEAAPVQGAEGTAAPELTIVDLQNLRQIVDLASRRGAFGGPELSSVGAVFDRLNTFLNAVSPQQPAEAPAEEEKQAA